MRVLVVEDNADLRVAVCAELGAAGFEVVAAGDMATATGLLRAGPFACVVLDRMLPDGDALAFVHRGRQHGHAVPVLFMTARDTVADRIAGFDHGCDDYLVKPFAMAELTARVHTLARRGAGRPSVLRFADLEVDSAQRKVRRGGVLLTLSDKEFAVLEYLVIRPRQVVTRAELIEHCWDEATDPMSNVVDVAVGRLRRKLHAPNLIQSVRGAGYRLDETG